MELFHRNRQGVRLTEAGQVFLEQARLTLAQAEQAKQMVQQIGQAQATTLNVGFSMCAFDRLLPKIVQSFRASFPAVKVCLSEMASAEQVQALITGEIDCGFLHLSIVEDSLATETLLKESVVVALPKSHPLAVQDIISLRSLAHESFMGSEVQWNGK